MSELETQRDPEAVVPDLTAGKMLRAAREASGIHIAALSVAMKVPVKKLEALEADRFDLLTDAVFVRALASSMCRALKVDATEVLNLLPRTTGSQFDSAPKGMNAPFRHAGERRHKGLKGVVARPVVMIVLGLLLAALGIFFAPELRWDDLASSVPESRELDQKARDEALSAAERSDERNVPVEVVPGPANSDASKRSVVPATTEQSIGRESNQLGAPAASAPAPKAADMVGIRAREETWVEIVDANGAVLVRRIIPAQGVAVATGPAPLAVVVGRADAVTVEVKGKAFSILPFAKDNVARFEVK
jgi:cytoskeleton protein RodZ